MARKPVPPSTELSVLKRSRRRCALCWGLQFDLDVKRIQIAHVDRDSSNSEEDNLVALCQTHHEDYDTLTSQTKRLTVDEVLEFREELYDILEKKKRAVELGFVGPDGTLKTSATDTERLGLLVDAFDEDLARERPNGVGLSALAHRFFEIDGDFSAGREIIRSLLRLIGRETASHACAGVTFLLGRNNLLVASPVVSLARALLAATRVDGMLFVTLVDMVAESAVEGERRSFDECSIKDMPQAHAASVSACLFGIARGAAGACGEWVQNHAVKELAGLVSRITIAYALQGYEFPDGIKVIYEGHHGRVAPGPNFIGPNGPIQDYERGNWPPDLWFSVMNMLARLGQGHFERAVAAIPLTVFDWERLFAVSDDEVRSVEQAKNLGDLWTTERRGGVAVIGRINLGNQRELAEVVAHVRHQKGIAEHALNQLRRCLDDERRLLLKTAAERAAKKQNP